MSRTFFRRAVPAATFSASALMLASVAGAYSTESVASDGCHEAITFSAIRGVRMELTPAGAMPATNEDEQALIGDLPFDVPDDMHDLAAAAAVLGNRNVDLRDNESDDLDSLAPLHGDPSTQDEHCLRGPNHDEPGGDQAALELCRAAIRGRVHLALGGLDAQGMPDPTRRTKGDVFLELRGVVEASLPTYWWEIGRALHTVQDGFSHAYRSQEDQRRVIAVLNYVDVVGEVHDEATDGPEHSSSMDRCKDLDDFRKQRIQLAVDASADLLRATLDPALDGAGKEAAVEEMLDRYFSYQAGCTAENGWCDAPEADYTEERGCVCSAPGAGEKSGAPWLLFGALAFVASRRRRRGADRRRGGPAALALGATALLLPARALAQEPMPPPYESDMQADTAEKPVVPEEKRGEMFPLGVHAAAAASIAQPGGAASLGLRYRLSKRFLVGVDGEYNPFYSETHQELKPGVTNVYATGVLRFPMSFENVNLRSTLNLGISRMNFDLYGVPEGSIGPFIGFNLLGLDFELSKQVYLVVNPAYVAIPIPQTTGVPYSYPQYRIQLGFQFGA